MMTGCMCRTTALKAQRAAAMKPLAPSRHGWVCARVALAPVVTASAAASSRTAPAPDGASAAMPPAVSSTMGASACGASCQEVRSTPASAAASDAPSLDESLLAYMSSAAMASHSGSVLSARGPTGAGGLGALASLAGVLPAGRGVPSSRLVVGSASVLVSGGSLLKPRATPAFMPVSAKALP